jgi:hypothetical protein
LYDPSLLARPRVVAGNKIFIKDASNLIAMTVE